MNTCKYILILLTTSIITLTICPAGTATESTFKLAQELAMEGKHEAAAIEYRRLAMMEEQRNRCSGYYWASAYEYLKASKYDLVQKMLDRAEDNSSVIATEALLVRAEASLEAGKLTEAEFFLKSIIDAPNQALDNPAKTESSLKIRTIASKKLARVFISKGDYNDAIKTLAKSPAPCPEAIRVVGSHQKGHDRSPRLGGILGLIPGLGYTYSGEYANAVRSLILNGLFIYAMTETADREQWGAFSALSFFELTWYTGSIYGGIDAAHRFNQNRLNDCIKEISRGSGFTPDFGQMPLVSLKFEF